MTLMALVIRLNECIITFYERVYNALEILGSLMVLLIFLCYMHIYSTDLLV